jgi:outer membrane protein
MSRRARVFLAALAACALGLPLSSAQGQTPPPPPAGAPTGTSALTLDLAVQAALARNPSVVAAAAAVTAAEQGVVAARAGLAPTVSASATGALGTSSATSFTSGGTAAPLSGPSATGSLSLGATLPLYDAGLTPARVESAEAALSSAQAALRQIQQDTSLAVATAFFNVLASERITTVREAQLAQAQQQLALSEAQARAGVAAQADVIQAQATVAQAQVNLLLARSQIATSKAGLQAAIGTDAAAPVEVQEPPAPPLTVPITADAAIQAAVTDRAEVAKGEAAVQSGQAALELARINAGPQASVGVGTTYTPVSTSPVLANSASYGLTATIAFPLYNVGAQAGIDQAQANLRSAQAQLDATLVSVRQDAYQAYLTAVQDAQTITATEAARAAADAALAVAEGQYRAGVGTIVLVVTAQANAAQAEVNAVNAVYTYETALATLRHAQGMPIVADRDVSPGVIAQPRPRDTAGGPAASDVGGGSQ